MVGWREEALRLECNPQTVYSFFFFKASARCGLVQQHHPLMDFGAIIFQAVLYFGTGLHCL